MPYMRFYEGGFSRFERRFPRRIPDAAAGDGIDGARRILLHRRRVRFFDAARNPSAASAAFACGENRFLDGRRAACGGELGLRDLQFELKRPQSSQVASAGRIV